MTATFPTLYLPPLCRLLTIPLLTADSILRGSEIEFQQCEIEMRTSICSLKGQFVSKELTLLAKFIRDNQLSSAVVFCNYRKQSQHFRDHLEWKLNELKLNVDNVDVIHINGSLHKTDKFWRICLFCDEDHISKADYRVLVTTNAANVGIDKHSIALQVRFEWLRDLLTYFQERGRGSRQRGTESLCTVYSTLSSYASLVYQLLCGNDDTCGDETQTEGTQECEGFNPAISPRRPDRQANTSQHDFALGPAAKKQLRARSLTELHEVMRFFCLNFGCQHKRGEIYLLSGSLDSLPATGHCTSCLVCNRTYHKDFLPVYRSGVESFLEWLTATADLPFMFDFKVQVSSLLMLSTYWKEIIFDKASVSVLRANVDALFLSLAACGILEIQNTSNGMELFLGCQAPRTVLPNSDVSLINATIGEAEYKAVEYWMGLNLHPAMRIRVLTPSIPIL